MLLAKLYGTSFSHTCTATILFKRLTKIIYLLTFWVATTQAPLASQQRQLISCPFSLSLNHSPVLVIYYSCFPFLHYSFTLHPMKGLLIISLFLMAFFSSCRNNTTDRSDTTSTSENDVDAARNFIRLFLDGDLEKARSMLVTDSLNSQIFDAYERIYNNRNQLDKKGYKGSSIQIHSVRTINDSISVVSYSNSFKKIVDSLKVMKDNGAWKIDLKYSLTPQ